MSNQVIVVDDYAAAAAEYARLISLRTKLRTIATSDPQKALDIVRENPISVAVLDQRMPEKEGTQLFSEITRIDPLIKAIMLTGEAEPQEVGEAFGCFGYSDYIHKSKVQELPQRVLLQHARYQVDLANKDAVGDRIVLSKFRKGIGLGNSLEIRLASVEVLDEEFIFPNSWRTVRQVKVGESVKEVDKVEITNRYIHETDYEERWVAKLGIGLSDVVKFKADLEGQITNKFKDHLYSENKNTLELVREYKLPAEPCDPNERCVISRHFQRAHVYRRLRCLILRECGCCGNVERVPEVLYQLTSKLATKHTDYLSDGSTRELDTGIETY